MLLIHCPYCAMARPEPEFRHAGAAHIARPADPAATSDADWAAYLYLRDNPRGAFDEYTHHAAGCRAWLVVSRNTETHEVYGCVTARQYKAGVKA